jgi:type III secretion system low calcium response chaperone LcrH/SycD
MRSMDDDRPRTSDRINRVERSDSRGERLDRAEPRASDPRVEARGEARGGGERPKTTQLATQLQRWADGKATLKDVRGYSDEELYAVAKTAYYFFYQGRLNEARTLFQGLYAVNPLDAYFAKALGVVELAAGNVQGALSAYDVAIKLAPSDPSVYVGRAEVKLYQGNKGQAADDLRKAISVSKDESPIRKKAWAMLQSIGAGGSRNR